MPAAARRPANTNGAAEPRRRFASVQAVAEMFDVDPATVRRWIASGLVTGYRVGDRLVKLDIAEVERKVVQPIPTADEREAAPARTGR
jgi:hypothetical protein